MSSGPTSLRRTRPEHRTRRTRWLTVALLVALTVSAACSDGASRPAPKDSKVLDMLDLVPSTKTTRQFVVVNLYAKAAEAAKVDRPKPGASERSLIRYLTDLMADRKIGTFLRPAQFSLPDPATFRSSRFGFNLLHMDADVQAGTGAGGVQLARGHFDRGRIRDRVMHDRQLAGRVHQATHHGVAYDRWSDASPLPSLGRDAGLALPDDNTLLAASSDELNAGIDVAKGDGRSLADEPDFAAAGKALDGLDVFAAAFIPGRSAPRFGRGPSTTPSSTKTGSAPKLVATGVAREPGKGDKAGKTELVIVYVNADERTAKDNATRLREQTTQGRSAVSGRPWKDLLKVRSVRSDGRLTIGVFTTGTGRLWYDLVRQFDPLIMPG